MVDVKVAVVDVVNVVVLVVAGVVVACVAVGGVMAATVASDTMSSSTTFIRSLVDIWAVKGWRVEVYLYHSVKGDVLIFLPGK